MDGDGRLNEAEFAVAMHLIQQTLKGHAPPPLPHPLPAPLLACVQQAVRPQLPIAEEAHVQKCKSAFGAFLQNVGKGVLGGGWGLV